MWPRSAHFAIVLLGCCILQWSHGQVLTPPYFNLAQGRRIVASATCGEDVREPELFCKLIGANAEDDNFIIQGQVCDHCDPKKEDKKHPPEFAVDGRETWWQSPPLSRGMKYNEVNLTIDLGQEFHVAYVLVKMGNSPKPAVWVLERSNDNGSTYSPWQYFAESVGDCYKYFGNVSTTITADDSVICDTQFSNIVPVEGGDIIIPLVQNRPSANDFFNSTVLQEWTRATNVRFRLLRVKNLLGHLMSVARNDPTTTRRYFYSIKDISIGGRCRCNGHADTCTSVDKDDPNKLVCDCKDNTCGAYCETCCPGFEQKKWSQSKSNKKFICEKCNCFGHSDQCKYNETVDQLKLSLDIQGNYEGGGVCQNCQHFTEGINCDKCVHGYHRPAGKKLDEIDACQPCDCNLINSTGNCEDITGACECKPEYTKPNCDTCSTGHYGFPYCRPCECYMSGTVNFQCNPDSGKCFCKNNFGGDLCRNCTDGYYNFPECKTCDCNSVGSVSNICNAESGDCKCKNSYSGRTCDQCSDGYYKFPSCSYCNCDVKGTLPGVCDKSTGQCMCKPEYGGSRCDQCIANFTGFPDCKPCNCSADGSLSAICDITGKCTCLGSYAGKLCDQCAPGYYQYPKCLPCECSPIGTVGVSCNSDGKCKCKNNFDGDKCESCKTGYYKHPLCEECNFNPAGVISTFSGCSTPPESSTTASPCKANVEGNICGNCKDLFWNLQIQNPDGCEECSCNRSGTVGRIGLCDSISGQCICKPSSFSRKCDQCLDGWYNLTDSNLFGCTDCGCDIGGSSSNTCNKVTGQCVCLPRIGGRNCKDPLDTHYFPTLHQYQYEVEDGRTPAYTPVRYGFDESVFPGYSWKGYAVFSHLQNETVHQVFFDKSSVYRMILRYTHFHPQSITGTISMAPEYSNNVELEQKFQVVFKPTAVPSFVTVAGVLGNNPSPFVLDSGSWIIKIKNEKSLFLDYFVLIPAEYYEGSALVSHVTTPCTLDKAELCRLYSYPNISSFDQVRGLGAYIDEKGSRSSVREFYDELEEPLGIGRMPKISNSQQILNFNLRISRPGPYVLVVNYATTANQDTTNIQVQAITENNNKGQVTIYRCRYRTLCRQVVSERDGRVSVFDFDTNNVNLILKGAGDGIGIDSIHAIPKAVWSTDYLQPKPSCIINDTKCVPFTYLLPPDSERFDFKIGNENRITKTQPSIVMDNSTELVYLDENDAMIDITGKVPKPGLYTFVVHYYQPDYPDFDSDIILHNGQSYEAKLPTRHCPSVSGCRSVVKQQNGNTVFQLTENFVFTLKVPADKGLWAHYVLLIPSSQYTEDIIHELPFDQTAMFLSKCGLNHFYLNTSEEGFCKEAAFSLTSKYNHGALTCHCDWDGSTSFQCEKFGGQCPCRENVIGKRCDNCKTGYFGFPSCKPCNCSSTAVCDPNTGDCICPPNVVGIKCNQCRPYTYGFDPIIGCEECNCNVFGVENNDLQCDLFTGACKCKKNVEGRTCDRCLAGRYQFPYCNPCQCDLRGTTEEICNQANAACFCKSNVQGLACDVCKDGTFNLQPDDPTGCTKCFCFGKTTRCSSSTLFTSLLISHQNWTLASIDTTNEITVQSLPTLVEEVSGGISVNMGYVLGGIAYFVAPQLFLGNKLTAYGGFLNYTVHYTSSRDGIAVASPDVILYGANMYLYFTSVAQPDTNSYFPISVKMVEDNFQAVNGDKARREDLMQVLQNLTAVYVKATYVDKGEITKLLSVSFEVAIPEYSPSSGLALSVEQCSCPPNYSGLSCEECADGYYRVSTGLFGGNCLPCQCNGHASTCDKATGICIGCKHNTKGDHCEKCETGYYGNATVGASIDCLICACPLPVQSNNFATGCVINESDERVVCDCIPGYTGNRCEKCAPGYYGNPDVQGEKCIPCQCNDNINPSEPGSCDPLTGKCLKCLNNTFGDSCEKCAPDFYGDAVVAKNCQACDCDKCGTKECDHRTGQCTCNENVLGEKCDRCATNHYGFTTCQGCYPCNCEAASQSYQCDDFTGHCKCKDGVVGRTCDKCAAGYWKYSPEGCTSCGCNIGYSLGLGCNTTTGLCQCLPGVVGDKCDTCPYRSVLIPNDGCLICDNCTHGLLDVTDQIQSDFQPVFQKFQTTAIGYFTAQRLVYINNTVNSLSPNVSDIYSYQFDLTPYINKIMSVEKEKETSLRKIQSIVNDVVSSSKKGSSVITDALEVELLVNRVKDRSEMTVYGINELSFNLESGTVPQTEHAITQSKSILDQITSVEIDEETLTGANSTLSKAQEILSRVSDFSSPLNKTVQNVEVVKKNVEILQNKLDDLQTLTEKAQKLILDASSSTQLNKKDKLIEKINSLNEATKEAKEVLDATSTLLQNTTEALEKNKADFVELGDSTSNLKSTKDKTSQSIDSLVNGINSVRESVYKAKEYADNLEEQAKILDSVIKQQVSSDHAVRAANSYKDIVSALEAASKAINEAKGAIESTSDKFQGVDTRGQYSNIKSTDLLDMARKALEDVQQKLAPELSVTLSQQNAASKSINQTSERVENLQTLINKQKEDANNKSPLKDLNVDGISSDALNTLNNMKNTIDNLPTKLSEAKELYTKLDNTRKFAQQTANYLDQNDLQNPEIGNRINKLKSKPAELEQKEKDIENSLNSLKQTINITRDLAAKITVGVSLNPNTFLELPVPQALLEQGMSTDLSLYFKTNQLNGLLMYIGNQATQSSTTRVKRDTPKPRRPKMDDFLALEIENGYLLLTLDLGEKKPFSITLREKFIGDDKWYKVEAQRVGKVVNLTVVEQLSKVNVIHYSHHEIYSGFSAVLNLDKDYSKFFIGGLPGWFDASIQIKYPTFSGKVEEVTVSRVPIGLWNFVNASTINPQASAAASINGATERDVLLPNTTAPGCRFSNDGYVALSSKGISLTKQSSIAFKFKTTSSNGLLFLAFKDQTFMSIELKQGFIYFQFDVGYGLKSFHTRTQFNDNQWHDVSATRIFNRGTFAVDNALEREDTDDRQGLLYVSDYIYVGGYPGDHKLANVINDHFDGCIDNFLIDPNSFNLNKNLNNRGIIPGCPEKFTRSVTFEEGVRKYIRWPDAKAAPKFSTEYPLDLTLRIKTVAKYGLIAYGIDGSYSFHLNMREGGIVFTSGKQEVSSGQNVKYNDDRWHSILIIHGPDALHLIVDDFDFYKSAESPQSIDIKKISLYFGSVPADVDAAAAIERPFVGSVGDAVFKAVVINFDHSFDKDEEKPPGPQSTPSTILDTGTVPTSTTTLPPTVTAAPGCLPLYPAPDTDINKDSGNRFGTVKNSALLFEFNQLPLKGKIEISIEAKTISTDGIIFYVSHPQSKDFIALYLKDSKLYLSFSCASNPGTIISEEKINEGEWHTLYFSINQNQGLLRVDDKETMISSVGCQAFKIAAPFYLGGMDSAVLTMATSQLEGFNKTFSGCLKNFVVNDLPYDKPISSIGVIPCSTKVESGTFFPASGGYLTTDEAVRIGRDIEISLQIKPRNLSGLLFGLHAKKHFLTLQLVNGAVNLTVDHGSGSFSAVFIPEDSSYFCNGNWHQIIAVKTKNVATVSVNGITPSSATAFDPGNQKSMATNNPFYIGGYPPDLIKSRGIEGNGQYIGCMKDLKIKLKEKEISLSPITSHGNVMFNVCPTI